eukprot:gene8003-8650_t
MTNLLPITFILLCFLNCISSLPNVYFLPGFSGNFLSAKVNSTDFLPLHCQNVALPINESFIIYPNATLNRRCLSDLLYLNFDPSDSSFRAPEGVTIETPFFGREIGLRSNYYSFFKQLESWGYEVGKTLFGIPYDFRFGSDRALRQIGFTDSLKQLIERNYRLNGGKAILIGHSNGGPTIYAFLQSMPRAWKEKYMGGMITLSGNLLGQMNAFISFFATESPNEVLLQRTVTTWEATYTSTPWGNYHGLDEVKDFIVTYSGDAEKEAHYSPHLEDMQRLFTSVSHSDWSEILGAVYPSMDRSNAPEAVDVYCLYGSALETDYAYVFDKSITDNAPIETLRMEGDGNQEIIDNEFCNTWKDAVINKEKKSFESIAFPGVDHMQMYTDDNVLQEVQRILQLY